MHLSRRHLLLSAAALAATAHAAPQSAPPPAPQEPVPPPPPADPALAPLFTALDAVGPLDGHTFHPRRALDAIVALQALDVDARMPALHAWATSRAPDVPSGVFAVVRAALQIPGRDQPATEWPGALQPGYLRPPALGGPTPPAPDDPTLLPRFPVFVLEDVPLVVVSGYTLRGKPEPLTMHLDGLAEASWRTEPFRPGNRGEVRYLLMHFGLWNGQGPVIEMLEGQLKRYDAG